jgi:hypothetical protein
LGKLTEVMIEGDGSHSTGEETMSHGRLGERGGSERRRRPWWGGSLELLEGRDLLSGAGGSVRPPTAAEVQVHDGLIHTSMTLRASVSANVAGPHVSLTASVRSPVPPRLVNAGEVRFSVVSPTPEGLGQAHLNKLGQATITTAKLGAGQTYVVQGEFIPGLLGYARNSTRLTVSTGPPVATAFRITAAHYFGAPGTPLTFTVTAVNRQNQPITGYTGTIDVLSTTDSAGKASPRVYTFTTADQGSHTFVNGFTFHKGGAEILKVHQSNNTKVVGQATFGIE